MENQKKNQKLRCICEGAIFIAAAAVIGLLRVVPVPYGGSIDLVMMPLVFFAVRWGLYWGLGAGLVYGGLEMLLTGGIAFTWQAILLDYFVAFMMVGLAGIMKNRKWGLVTGGIIGGCGRYLIHFLSGIIIWGEYMPEEFLSLTMTSTWIYSLLYNGVYMIPNIILVCIFGAAASIPLKKYIKREDMI